MSVRECLSENVCRSLSDLCRSLLEECWKCRRFCRSLSDLCRSLSNECQKMSEIVRDCRRILESGAVRLTPGLAVIILGVPVKSTVNVFFTQHDVFNAISKKNVYQTSQWVPDCEMLEHPSQHMSPIQHKSMRHSWSWLEPRLGLLHSWLWYGNPLGLHGISNIRIRGTDSMNGSRSIQDMLV
jgi:hypothetical protein